VHKRSLLLFILLLAFWLMLSAAADGQHLLVGALVALISVWFWQDLGPRMPGVPSAWELLRLIYCLILMVGWIIQANVSVAKTLLFSLPPAKPIFLLMEPNLRTNWGRVLFATCITIAPGSLTVDVDPETGRFIVHALTQETGIDLLYWRLIDEIIKLETKMERGTKHVVAASGANGSDSPCVTAGNDRPNSD
jgi:multisubunit Na+/H+ antiporter MnhE subunit